MTRSRSIPLTEWCVLVAAALNSLSYFYWSSGWGNLFGGGSESPEGIGFPLLFWHNQFEVPNSGLLPVNFVVNVGLPFLIGAIVEWSLGNRRPEPAGIEAEVPGEGESTPNVWQLSLGELMMGTAVLAVIFAASGRSSSLEIGAIKTIYLAGPILFAWIAWVARKLPGQWHRILGLGPAESIPAIHDFTRGLMGIFVCWIPQIVGLLLFDLVRRKFFPRRPKPVPADFA